MPTPNQPLLIQLRDESPALLGLAAAFVLLWTRGRAFVPMGLPAGFDWERYHREAWKYLHGNAGSDTWLEPLYLWLLSSLGELLGYGTAGLMISSVALVLLVCGAALIARAMAGPWAAGVTALAIPLTAPLAQSARWVNLYPLLGAATALTVGGAAAYARWPRWRWAVLAGLAGGLACAVDPRGPAVVPTLCVLMAIGLAKVSDSRRRAGAVLLFALTMASAPLLSTQLREAPGLSKTQIALDRRGLELSNLSRQSSDVRTSCQEEGPELLGPAALLRPCAQAFQDFNQPRVRRVLPFGLIFTLLCLPLLLLPARRGWRQALMAAAVFAPPVLFVWLLSRWIAMSPRYVLQMMGPLTAVVPVALASLVRTLLPKPRAALGTAIAGLGLGAWVLVIGPPEREAAVPLEASATYTMTSPIIRYIGDEVGESDLLLDCSESHIEAAILPRQLHSPPSNHEGQDWRRCDRWIAGPPPSAGTRWVITGQRSQLDRAPSGQLQRPWVRALHTDGVGHHLDLWRWQAE